MVAYGGRMQSTISLEIKVGLLLIAGLIAIVVLVMVSDRVDINERYVVKAYLPNADGLLVGSPVSLAGIRVGNVTDIKPDTTGRNAILVKMEIIASYDIPSSAELTLATAGILGDAYMSFAPTGALGVPLRKDGKAEVDGSPGMLMKISEQAQVTINSVNALIDEESRSDVKRLLKSSADTMEQSAQLLAGLNARQARLDGILDRVDTLLDTGAASLQTITKRVDETLLTTSGLMAEAESSLQTIGPRTDSTMASVESVVTRIDQAFGDEQHGLPQIMADTSSSLNSLADILGQLKDGRGVIGQLLRSHSLAQDLNDTAIDLRNAASTIADEPSVLVWGMGEEESAEQKKQRQTLRDRRAFMEGYAAENETDAAAASPAAE